MTKFYFIVNYTPLIHASENGQTEIVEFLLSQPGVQINCKNIYIHNKFIKLALSTFIIFHTSIASGVDILLCYFSPLIYASMKGYTDIVRLLLSQPGIEINCKNISTLDLVMGFIAYNL